MLHTFNAVLKGNQLQWTDDLPQIGQKGDRPLKVQVTILEEVSDLDPKSRGQKMADILEKLANSNTLLNVYPIAWQSETHSDNQLGN